MTIFWYRIALGCAFWFFMSPFIIKTANTLQGRGAGILIGAYLIICAYVGLRKQGVWPVRGIAIGGVACMVWGLVGGKIMHVGGTFHDIVLGLIFLLLAWLISRVPTSAPCECGIDGATRQIVRVSIENDELVCYTNSNNSNETDVESVRISFATLLQAGAMLSVDHCSCLVRGLIRTANRLHKR